MQVFKEKKKKNEKKEKKTLIGGAFSIKTVHWLCL